MEIIFLLGVLVIIMVLMYIIPRYPFLGMLIGLVIATIGVGGAVMIIYIMIVDFVGEGIVTLLFIAGFFLWLFLVWGIIHTYLENRRYKSRNLISPQQSSSNQTQGEPKNQEVPKVENTKSPVHIEKLTFKDKINFLDIGTNNAVIFTYKDGTSLQVRLKNLAKITQEIINDFRRNEFSPGELENHFQYIKQNYATTLNAVDYSIVLRIVERFVKEGGKIDVITAL